MTRRNTTAAYDAALTMALTALAVLVLLVVCGGLV